MITIFAAEPGGPSNEQASFEAAADLYRHNSASIWIDVEKADAESLSPLAELFQLDASAIEDALFGNQRPRLDEYDEYLFLILYGILPSKEDAIFNPGKLSVFFHDRFLVTVHDDPLPSITGARTRCMKPTDSVMARGIGHLLYAIIDGLVDNYTVVADTVEDRLDLLEDRVMEPDAGPDLLGELTDLKRDILYLHRLATSQRELIQTLVREGYTEVPDDLQRWFGHVRDHLTAVVELANSLREMQHAVHDMYHANLASRLNAVMKTLTLFATLMLPLSLIAGIYGMNVPLWPSPTQPLTTVFVMGAMGVTTVVVLVYFYRKRWL